MSDKLFVRVALEFRDSKGNLKFSRCPSGKGVECSSEYDLGAMDAAFLITTQEQIKRHAVMRDLLANQNAPHHD